MNAIENSVKDERTQKLCIDSNCCQFSATLSFLVRVLVAPALYTPKFAFGKSMLVKNRKHKSMTATRWTLVSNPCKEKKC